MNQTDRNHLDAPHRRVSPVVIAAALILAVGTSFAQWGPVVQLSHTDVASSGPSLAVRGSFVHATWYDQSGGARCAAYRRSTDGGASWDSVTVLRGDPGVYKYADYLTAMSGSSVHFAYDSSLVVYYRRSVDNGATWSSSVAVCACTVDMHYLAQNNTGTLFLAYHAASLGDTMFMIRSTDDGVTWSPPTAIARFSYTVNMRTYFVTEYPPVLFFAFERYDGGDTLFLARSTNNGISWESARPTIAFQGSGDRDWAFAADGRGRLHVGWEDNRTGNYEIYYARSTDNGTTWSPADRRTTSTGAFFKNLRAHGDMVYLCYQSYVPPGGQQRSTDGGLSWAEGDFGWADVAYCVAFGDSNWVHLGSSEYSRSKDGGSTWPYTYGLSPEGFVYDLVLSGGNVHLCWTSYASGNYEVYYCRGTGLAGVGEGLRPQAEGFKPAATIIRGMLFLPSASGVQPGATSALLDISGRKVLDLKSGANDVRNLAPGMYFVREAQAQAVCKVVVTH